LRASLAGHEGAVADIARDMLEDIAQLTRRINTIETQLSSYVRIHYEHLLTVPGLGVLGAATIIGETAGAGRFRTKDAFARFNGTAPIPVWSGNTYRVRLSRGGNRRINTALHMAAVTQQRLAGEGATYYAKQLAAGKTRTEAMRLLRRKISDCIFAALKADEHANPQILRSPQTMSTNSIKPDHASLASAA